jgi:hypothetical protein
LEEDYDLEVTQEYAKLFGLLMRNAYAAKWVARNMLDELGSVLVVLNLSDKPEGKFVLVFFCFFGFFR